MSDSYDIRLRPAARRAIAEHLPEDVAAAVIEFMAGPLTTHPLRVGKPLRGPLTGCYGARRGTYRIVYQVDDEQRIVNVLDVGHRATVYRRQRVVHGEDVGLEVLCVGAHRAAW